MKTRALFRQNWLESERGWGTRPDGYSLHTNKSGRDAFIREYWSRMPDEIPDEYSRPEGDVYVVRVDDVTYKAVLESRNGTRHYH